MSAFDLHNQIDTISIHPFAVPVHDITELEEIRNEQIENNTYHNQEHDDPDPLELLEEELWEFLRYSGSKSISWQAWIPRTEKQLSPRYYPCYHLGLSSTCVFPSTGKETCSCMRK